MADAKIEIKVGAFSFTGEGTENWLSSELDKLLAKIPQLVEIAPAEAPGNEDDQPRGASKKKGDLGTLAHFLKAKSATNNQVKKFLATAVYLHDTTGKKRLSTRDVKDALSNASQSKLTNAANCLNLNNGKGHCEKDGSSGFYVTDAGRTSLGA